MPISRKQLGENLTVVRRARNVTQAELARSLGVRRSTYANWEQGTSALDATMLVDISDKLQVRPSVILGEKPISAGFEDEFVERYASLDDSGRSAVRRAAAIIMELSEAAK